MKFGDGGINTAGLELESEGEFSKGFGENFLIGD